MEEILNLIEAVGKIQFVWNPPLPGRELYQDGWSSAAEYLYDVVKEILYTTPIERHKVYLKKMSEVKKMGGG